MLSELDKSKSMVLGITGASGAIYGFNLLKFFLAHNFKLDLVLSDNALKVAKQELDLDLEGLKSQELKKSILRYLSIEDLAKRDDFQIWEADNIAASISSGSYKTQGMIIAPASMGTIANIAAGTSNNLIARAADVTLKERRKLILLARETPLSTIHLRNMLSLSEMGAVILPASPGFYHRPNTMQEQINFILGKTLDQFDIENKMFEPWTGKERSSSALL